MSWSLSPVFLLLTLFLPSWTIFEETMESQESRATKITGSVGGIPEVTLRGAVETLRELHDTTYALHATFEHTRKYLLLEPVLTGEAEESNTGECCAYFHHYWVCDFPPGVAAPKNVTAGFERDFKELVQGSWPTVEQFDLFFANYGTHFVSEVGEGGALHFISKDKQDLQSTKASLDVSAGVPSGVTVGVGGSSEKKRIAIAKSVSVVQSGTVIADDIKVRLHMGF